MNVSIANIKKYVIYNVCMHMWAFYLYIYIYYANDDSFTCAAVFVFGCDEYIFLLFVYHFYSLRSLTGS